MLVVAKDYVFTFIGVVVALGTTIDETEVLVAHTKLVFGFGQRKLADATSPARHHKVYISGRNSYQGSSASKTA